MTYKLLSQSDPFSSFGDQERVLAKGIADLTGIVPLVDISLTPEEEAVPVLRFWLRNSDGMVVARDLDLHKFKNQRECVKHALREAMRTARLDHTGGPVTEPAPESHAQVTIAQAIVGGYEQALIDFGIDKAGDFNPEGWYQRALDRATWREKC